MRAEQVFTVADLFAGAGGLSLGFEIAGFKVVVAAEIDENAKRTYLGNRRGVEMLGDVREVSGEELLNHTYKLDMIIGGPPCALFSRANARKYKRYSNHPHFKLVWEFARVVEEAKPRVFVLENVPQLGHGLGAEVVKSMVERLKHAGYNSFWSKILNAADFGVPQERRRFFLVGAKDLPVGGLSRILGKYKKGPVTVREAIGDLPPIPEGDRGEDVRDYGEPCLPEFREKLSPYQRAMRRGARKLYNHVCSKHSEEVVRKIARIKPGSSLRDEWPNLSPEERRSYIKTSPEKLHSNIYRRLEWDKPAFTITHARKAMILHPQQNRIISVREAARLQSFPDAYRFYGGITSQYQQVADAVPPLLAKALAVALLKIMKKKAGQR